MNDFLGNDIMNPQRQQQEWMDRPIGNSGGLDYLRLLDSLLVKQVVSLTECMLNRILEF
jgi:hypothetical protein